MSDLSLKDIRKSFARVQVLHGIDIDIRAREFVSLLGASGCGKTTLLRIVAGLESTSAGSVIIDGQDVTNLPPEKREISMMFQSYALLPHLSVSENVRFPLRMRRIGSRAEQDEKVREALETVQLGKFADRRPDALSGGQQQRVALARAIVSKPKVLLLDEALSNLDALLREEMQIELMEIHRNLGLTTLFVTHDQDEALSLSDRVILLNDGRIEQEGAPAEIYARPATAFAAQFLGSSNLIRAEITAPGTARLPGDAGEIAVDPNMATGPAILAIRQEDIVLTPDADGSQGPVARLRTRVYMGSRSREVLDLGGQTVRALTLGASDLRNGDRVRLRVPMDRIARLDPTQGDDN